MGLQNYTQSSNPRNPIRTSLWHRSSSTRRGRTKIPRVELASVEHNDEALRLNLDLLDEKREQVLEHTESYQRKTARYYNQRVKPRSYMRGDLVLKKLLPARKNSSHGKLGPSWEGPYIVTRAIRPGNYELQMEEGKILPHTWNVEHLKRFYQ